MRIGLVCPYSFRVAGGVQSQVLGLADWLARAGHRVSVLAPEIWQLPYDDRPAGVSLVDGGPTIPIGYNGSVARINFGLYPTFLVRNWLRRFRLDVVHLHEPFTPSLAGLVLLQSHCPKVATFHANSFDPLIVRLASKLVARRRPLDATIAVSQVAAAAVEQRAGVATTIIGNGLDCAALRPSSDAATPPNDHPVVVFIGRFDEPRKGFGVLLRALPLLLDQHPDLEVVVVGRGAPRSIPHVNFAGGIDDTRRNELLRAADVYVAPNLGQESFGIVLLEAAAAGTEIVASDLPAFREVASDEHGPIAHLVPPGQGVALAHAINAVLRHRDTDRITRGMARAAQFDWSVIGPRVEAQYRLAVQREIP